MLAAQSCSSFKKPACGLAVVHLASMPKLVAASLLRGCSEKYSQVMAALRLDDECRSRLEVHFREGHKRDWCLCARDLVTKLK